MTKAESRPTSGRDRAALLSGRVAQGIEPLMNKFGTYRLLLQGSPLARRLVRRRVVAGFAAILVSVAVANLVTSAQRSESRWGTTTWIDVASRDLPAGTLLDDSLLTRRLFPTRLLPEKYASQLSGQRLARSLSAGELPTEDDLAPQRASAVTARLPDGKVGVTVRRGEAAAPVRIGDRVEVVRLAADSDRSLDARRITDEAIVVSAQSNTVTLAVSPRDANAVAAAGAIGTAVLILVP